MEAASLTYQTTPWTETADRNSSEADRDGSEADRNADGEADGECA
jgi:hypothetical protein